MRATRWRLAVLELTLYVVLGYLAVRDRLRHGRNR
jgi:hypothetical protein